MLWADTSDANILLLYNIMTTSLTVSNSSSANNSSMTVQLSVASLNAVAVNLAWLVGMGFMPVAWFYW